MKSNNSAGNVLFLILIAVALFAALSYAVTSSTRNSSSDISKDKARSYAAAIIQHTTSMRNAITRMKLSNGCANTTLDFTTSSYVRNDGAVLSTPNANSPTNKSCFLFDAAGGNISPIVPPAEALGTSTNSTAFKAGHGRFQVGQMKGVGTDGASGTESANDLIFIQQYINRSTCLAINDILGVPNPSKEPPLATATGATGNYIDGSFAATEIFGNSDTEGFSSLCHYNGTFYQYRTTMLER